MKLGEYGVLGIMLALLIYDVIYLQKQLLRVIDNNTRAMSDLKNHCVSRLHGHLLPHKEDVHV